VGVWRGVVELPTMPATEERGDVKPVRSSRPARHGIISRIFSWSLDQFAVESHRILALHLVLSSFSAFSAPSLAEMACII
jgi:hypothetical protein